MRKLLVLIVLMTLMVAISPVYAHEENFTEIKQLIESGASCDELAEDQLEAIGDYYMELMHPGEAHDAMDEMMGGEGSESLRQMHINMAYNWYCGYGSVGTGYGMMNMMWGGRNMMEWSYGSWYWDFLNVLYVILLIGLIILVYLSISKLWKGSKRGRR